MVAYPQQKWGKMVELALHESLDAITVETVSGPEGTNAIRVHLGFESTSEDLSHALISQGFGHACDDAISLFSDDSLKRNYQTQNEFVLVRKAVI